MVCVASWQLRGYLNVYKWLGYTMRAVLLRIGLGMSGWWLADWLAR